jgi:truncated hemoglobin YjbI
MPPAEKPSLYDRLGGVYSIATVVDDLIDRVMADPRLNANPLVDEADHRVPPAGFKYLVTEMVCWAAGGPQKYTGRSMADSPSREKFTKAAGKFNRSRSNFAKLSTRDYTVQPKEESLWQLHKCQT